MPDREVGGHKDRFDSRTERLSANLSLVFFEKRGRVPFNSLALR